MRAQGEDVRLSFPTVVAERDDVVIGFLATQPRKDAIVAGPLVVAQSVPRPGLLVIRLGEAYDAVLRRAGIKTYYFHVEPQRINWKDILEKTGAFEQVSADDTGTWFRRVIA